MEPGNQRCGPCSKDSESDNTASSFCYDCSEYLCTDCKKFHGRSKASRSHKVADFDSISLDAAMFIKIGNVESCQIHDDRLVTYLCKDHDTLCCTDCVVASHRKCNDVSSLEACAKVARQSNQHTNLKVEFDKFKIHSKAMVARDEERLAMLDNEMSRIKESVEAFKKRAIETIHALEKKTLEGVGQKFNFERGNICTHLEEYKEVEATVSDSCNILDNTMKRGTDNQLFATMYVLKKQLADLKESFGNVTDDQNHGNALEIDFSVAFSLLRELETSVDLLESRPEVKKGDRFSRPVSKMSIRTAPANQSSMRSVREPPSAVSRSRACELTATFNMQSATDLKQPSITGIAVLPDSRTVLVDENNAAMKVYNKAFVLVMEHSFDTAPFGVTVVQAKEVAVTLPFQKRISMVIVDKTILQRTYIQRSSPCYGIVKTDNNRLAVVSYIRRSFHTITVTILNMAGKELMQIDLDTVLSLNITKPFRALSLAASQERGLLYVPQARCNEVVAIDRDGSIVQKFSNKQLEHPTSVALDSDGNLMVVGLKSKDVHLFRPDGSHVRVLLSAMNGLHNPLCLAFDSRRDHVLLSNDGSPQEMKVFKLA